MTRGEKFLAKLEERAKSDQSGAVAARIREALAYLQSLPPDQLDQLLQVLGTP